LTKVVKFKLLRYEHLYQSTHSQPTTDDDGSTIMTQIKLLKPLKLIVNVINIYDYYEGIHQQALSDFGLTN